MTKNEGQPGMQREATKRLHTAHLALAVVSCAAATAVVWGALRPLPSHEIPAALTISARLAIAAGILYLLARAVTEMANYRRSAGMLSAGKRWFWPTVVAEAVLVLTAVGLLIRGHGSRGLLVGLDVLLPAVVVVAVLAIAVAVATRRRTTHRDGHATTPWPTTALALTQVISGALLTVVLLYIELQPLPNVLVE